MKKHIFLTSVLIFVAISCFAEIPIGTVLLKTNRESQDPTQITNGKGEVLPLTSGITLYKGDAISSNNESFFILVTTASMVIEVSPFTELDFNVLPIGSDEFVMQIFVRKGQINAERYPQKELIQVFSNIIIPPQEVSRDDILKKTPINALILYTQIIKYDAIVDTVNFDLSDDIFLTNPDIDIQKLINSLKSNTIDNEFLASILTYPQEKPPTQFNTYIKIQGLFFDFTDAQIPTGQIIFDVEREKFKIKLNFPFLFAHNNALYNPIGNKDMDFGYSVGQAEYEDYDVTVKTGLGIQSAFLSLLNRVDVLSYGNPNDNIHFYYGNQKKWHNENASMFMHQFRPMKAPFNNFNKDLTLIFNFGRFGNTSFARYFQHPQFDYSVIDYFDIFYNRLWVKPLLPFSPLEMGITFAGDLSLNKFSSGDKNAIVTNADTSQNSLLYTGIDLSLAIFNTYRFNFTIQVEGGVLFPSATEGFILLDNAQNSSFTNFGATNGYLFSFYNDRYNSTTGFRVAGSFTKGFFRSHIISSGYEYRIKPLYNRIVTEFAQDKNDTLFQTFTLIPEGEFFFKSSFFSMELGATYPFPLAGGDITEILLTPTIFLEFTFNLDRVTPEEINLDFSFFTAHPNLNYLDLTAINFLTQLGTPNNITDFSITLTVLKKYFIETGFYNSPFYHRSDPSNTNLRFVDNLPAITTVPYISFSLKI